MSTDGPSGRDPRAPLRPAPVKVRGRLGPQAPGADGSPPQGRSRGIRPVAPTATPEPLDAVPKPPRADVGRPPSGGASGGGDGRD